MRKTETYLYSEQQVSDHLGAALRVVADLELDAELKVEAFKLAVGMLSNKNVQLEQVAPVGGLLAVPREH